MQPILAGIAATQTPDLTFLGPIGTFAIIGALLLFLAAATLSATQKAPQTETNLPKNLFLGGTIGLFTAFITLGILFVNHQFQFRYIFRHSALDHELKYLISGIWSGQEGSFLLWAVASAIFGVLTINKTGAYRRWYTVIYSLFLAALAGILTFESPFTPNLDFPGATDGVGMPPSLLNYWVVIHPPTIFLGFGSLTVMFAWAVAALIKGNFKDYINPIRPWALTSLTLLGVGLCMGGFWAYETLGWGGFWMWDPVENTSFVPWVALAAFIHGIFVQTARKKWYVVNAILAALPFVLFCYGTFLTRSGFLGDTSVHSFAQMDRSALWLLTGLGGIALGTLIVTAIRAAKILRSQNSAQEKKEKSTQGIFQKESFYTAAIWLLLFTGVITAVGMSVPLIQSLANQTPKMVEEHQYHQILAWSFPFICLAMAIGPFLTWKNLPIKNLFGKIINSLSISIGLTGFLLLWLKWAGSAVPLGPLEVFFPGVPADPTATINFFGNVNVYSTPWVLFLIWLCAFAIVANITRGVQHFKQSKTTVGAMLTHAGVLITMLGLIASRGFEQKAELFVHPVIPPESRTAFGYQIDLEGRTSEYTDRYNKVAFNFNNGAEEFTAKPGLYFTPGQGGEPTPTMWPYIKSTPLYDMYIVAYPFTFNGSESTRLAANETARFHSVFVTNNGMRTEGTLGTSSAKFFADLTIDTPTGQFKASPSLSLGNGQMTNDPVQINDDLTIRLDRIDAATNDVFVTIDYATEMFPVDVFFKPLTILVWWGVGIMTFGGFFTAWTRRTKPKKPTSSNSQKDQQEDTSPADEKEDAPQQPLKV